MTASQIARWAETVQGDLRPRMRATLADALEAIRQQAVAHSSGTLTPEQSAAMGYAYSRRHPRPLLDPGIINVQTGELRASWTFNGPTEAGDSVGGYVFNVDPKADEVERGDARVWDRPIAEKVARDAAPAVERIISTAVADLLQP